jgi:hypothetical protein
MNYNYTNIDKILVYILILIFIGLLGCLFMYNLSFSFVEGFTNTNTNTNTINPWSEDLIKRFKIYQNTVNTNNYQYNMLILQQQATAADAEQLLATGYWPWSEDLKQQYQEAILRSPLIKVDSASDLDDAMKIYNQNAAKQLLAFNTKEGHFILYGTKGDGPNDTIRCSSDMKTSVLQKTVFDGYNLWNGYKNNTTTTIKNEDIPSQVKGFSFINGACNPCSAINENPDYNCPFKLNMPNGDDVSPIWTDLWHL